MSEQLSAKNFEILKDPIFDIPKQRPPGDFGEFLKATFDTFFARIDSFEEPLAGLIAQRRERSRALAKAILEAWNVSQHGDQEAASLVLEKGIRGLEDDLISMSRRHSTKVLPGQSWYRMAKWPGVNSRAHMSHAPYELEYKSYRFSTPGAPTLYLANSVYLCWRECGGDPNDLDTEGCFVSRFEVDVAGLEYLDLPCNHQAYLAPLDLVETLSQVDPSADAIKPSAVTNSPYDENLHRNLAEYLAAWPLLAAVSVTKNEPAPKLPPEYVIPQLVMLYARRSERYFGIRYFTSKPELSSNSQDWPIDLAVFTRTTPPPKKGYCDFLKKSVRCTRPQPLSVMRLKAVRDLATKEAVELREQQSGRLFLIPPGQMIPYFETDFGKMEYWLDRPEFPVDSIDVP